MSEDAVEGNVAMCEGCLAADRTLTKLGKHTYLFIKLVANLDPDVEPLMCWECISVFNKICKFQQQVSKAQFTLKYKHEFDPEFDCLSTLHKSNRIDYYDLEIKHKENERYKCAVVKLQNIDQLINQYLNRNVDNNDTYSDEDDKNDCNSDAAFYDSDEKHAVTNKDNKDDTNDINYYDDNDCKSEVNDADQSHIDFGDNDNENEEIDNNDCKSEVNNSDQSCNNFGDNDCKSQVNDGDQSHFGFSDNDIEHKKIDSNDRKSEVNNSDQSCYNFGENTEIDNGGLFEIKRKKRVRTHKKRFRYIYNIDEDLKYRDKLIKKVKVDKQELLDYMEKKRSTNCGSNLKINCELCLSKFSSEEHLRQHDEMYHSKSKKWMCDICKRTYPSQPKLKHHSYKHSKYICLQCGHVTYTSHLMSMHVKRNHKNLLECLQCQMIFPASQRKEFHKHYRDMHMTLICDDCGDQFNTKFLIERHIRKNHTEYICKECNLTFRRYTNMIYHKSLLHSAPQPTEHTYCVECDIQFPNALKFKNHLNKSKRHSNVTKSRVQCPGCDKTYVTKHIMTCHYNLVHLKKTEFYCEKCSKYFPNVSKLKIHIKRIHLKIPKVKNKLCPHCDRGFSDLHVLRNHIRTHTGERPFSCEHCPAAFAQKIAYRNHLKSIHKET